MPQSPGLDLPELAPVFADFGVAIESVHLLDPSQFAEARGSVVRGKGSILIGPIGAGLDVPAAVQLYRKHGDAALDAAGAALFFFKVPRLDAELARWRTCLWPWLHVAAVYRVGPGGIARRTLQGEAPIAGSVPREGVLLAARRREHAMSPRSTIEKFDQNAGGWNGAPGSPGYAHFRWMRRFVAHFAGDAGKRSGGAHVLDFGCGAGWVGIEAALASRDVELCAFDPSPEMVRIAEANARAAGVARFQARTGFGESPPFPAPGEKPFDLVLSSGVASFSPDLPRWCDGLVSTLAPGGVLVVGDIHRESRGMRRRRTRRVLLPAREMNALVRDEMRAELEKRGLVHEASAGYQLTDPVPQLAHRSRLLAGPLLVLNRLASGAASPGAQKHFDSWVMRFRRAR